MAFGQAASDVRPLRILVPVTAGGTSDVAARAIAEHLTLALRRPVYVENRVGGTGRLAVQALRDAASPADTLLMAPVAVPVIAPLVFRGLTYGPDDLAPVSRVGVFDYAFAVPVQSGLASFQQFAEWARKQSGKANFGAQAVGSVPHLLGVELGRLTGLSMDFVPFASLSQVEADLVGGHIASALSATTDFVRLHRAGRIRILATSGRSRSPLLPEVPTFRELGLPALEAVGWTGLFANARTPAAQIESLSVSVREALADTRMTAKLEAIGLVAAGTTPAEFASIIAADRAYWQPIVRASRLALDAP